MDNIVHITIIKKRLDYVLRLFFQILTFKGLIQILLLLLLLLQIIFFQQEIFLKVLLDKHLLMAPLLILHKNSHRHLSNKVKF